MLQFITNPTDKYSIEEQVQMALEGGCRWIQLRMKDADAAEIRRVASEIIPMCRENEAFLILDDHVELAIELGVHGVHLGKTDMAPDKARELMGAEAIIGVTANTAADITAMRGLDVDYVGLGPMRFTTTKRNLSPVIGLEGYGAIMRQIRDAGIELPVVAIGGITLDDIPELMAQGVDGVAMSGAIVDADDPVAYTRQVVDALQSTRH